LTLEFEKVVAQVERMGRALAAQNIDNTQRTLDAWEDFQHLGDLDAIWDRIQLARQRDAGFRGAAPLVEPINRPYPLPPLPERATLIAVDGSQVYPNPHGAALYYLTNVGVFVYHHGTDALPGQLTEPHLHYSADDLHDAEGRLIANEAVNARRNVLELEILARETWNQRDQPCSLVALRDGPLLFWVGKDVPDGKELQSRYLGILVWMHDAHAALMAEYGDSASLVGYVDRPTSAFVVSLLHLLRLPDEEVRGAVLATNGELEGLTDQFLMFKLLQPGERSALLVQQSPQNKRYHDKGDNYEIAFFYLNVGSAGDYHLARVEMPMWVARSPEAVNRVHALVYNQCQMMWHYPYALTRADELAVVRNHERTQLNEMIEIELRRNQQAIEHSEKLESKVVRHGRTAYGQKKR